MTNSRRPQSWAACQRDADQVNAVALFFTWPSVWYRAPCLFWPAPRGTPIKVDGRRVGPALLINETLDALTPFEGSLEVRKLFPNARLLVEPGGTTHAGSCSATPASTTRLPRTSSTARYRHGRARHSRDPGRRDADGAQGGRWPRHGLAAHHRL